jgi:hypothetical protein
MHSAVDFRCVMVVVAHESQLPEMNSCAQGNAAWLWHFPLDEYRHRANIAAALPFCCRRTEQATFDGAGRASEELPRHRLQTHSKTAPLAHKRESARSLVVAAADGEALGRSQGGLSTKVRLAVDGRGRPLAVLLTHRVRKVIIRSC